MSSSITSDRALQKVLRISSLNGWSVALFAGFCTLITALLGDVTGLVVGLLALASGVMELRGNWMLRQRHAGGVHWLVRAQLFLLSVILVYAFIRILRLDQDLALANLTPVMREALVLLDVQPEDLLPLVRTMVRGFYGVVMLVTSLYQGGLAFYYSRRKALVEEVFAAPPLVESIG